MSEIVSQILQLIETLVLTIGYPGVSLVMFIENVFPPIPTDPFLPFVGILVAQGELTFMGVWLSAIFGSTVGSLMLYFFGAWADERLIRSLIRRYGLWFALTEDSFDRAVGLFNRYGAPVVFIGRLIPVLRGPVSITAGVSRMFLPKFTLLTASSAATATWFYIYAGYLLGENWREILNFAGEYRNLLIVSGIISVSIIIILYVRWQSRDKTIDPDTLPPASSSPPQNEGNHC